MLNIHVWDRIGETINLSSAPHTLLNLKPSDSWTTIGTGKIGLGQEEWKGFSLVDFRKDLEMKRKGK